MNTIPNNPVKTQKPRKTVKSRFNNIPLQVHYVVLPPCCNCSSIMVRYSRKVLLSPRWCNAVPFSVSLRHGFNPVPQCAQAILTILLHSVECMAHESINPHTIKCSRFNFNTFSSLQAENIVSQFINQHCLPHGGAAHTMIGEQCAVWGSQLRHRVKTVSERKSMNKGGGQGQIRDEI